MRNLAMGGLRRSLLFKFAYNTISTFGYNDNRYQKILL